MKKFLVLLISAIALTFSPAYADHRVVLTPTVVVPQIYAIPVTADYYYSVGDGLDQEEREQRIAEAVVKKFEERFKLVQEESGSTPISRKDMRLMGATNSVAGDVSALFQASCIKCHKPGSPQPGVQLFNTDRSLFVNSDTQREYIRRVRVYESIESGEMPKNGRPLSAGQKALLKQWVEEAKVGK